MARKRTKCLAVAASGAVLVVLASLYAVPHLRERGRNVALGERWDGELRKHPGFSGSGPVHADGLTFTYAAPTDEKLTELRKLYDLDAVAGSGPEPERLINLLRWVFRLSSHANEPEIPKELNALNLIPMALDRRMQMNCYMKTVVLNEVYLSMGWPSRQTHLLPFEKEEESSHFVTSVYAASLGRWILMDPDFGVYLTDERGQILGVREMRRRLVSGEPFIVQEADPSGVLTRAWDGAQGYLRGADYRWFLSAFSFKIRCPQRSAFNQRAEPDRVYFELVPDGYRDDLLGTAKATDDGKKILYLNDEDLFWQRP